VPLDERAFDELAKEIAALNAISEETAQDYVARIGDTPELLSPDSDLVIVRDDNGAEIARIIFPTNE
jgi:hypothetical protein